MLLSRLRIIIKKIIIPQAYSSNHVRSSLTYSYAFWKIDMIYFSHLLWKLNVIGRLMVIRAVIIEQSLHDRNHYKHRTQINMLNTHKSTLREQSDIFVPFFYNRETRYAIMLRHKLTKSSPADGPESWITQGTQLWNLYTNWT